MYKKREEKIEHLPRLSSSMDKNFMYRNHHVIVYGFDRDDDGIAQTSEVFIDGELAKIPSGSFTEEILNYVDRMEEKDMNS